MIGAEDQTVRPEPADTAGTGDAEQHDVEETIASSRSVPEPGRLARGTVVGRYVVLGELGAGAMGRVYAAYDPKLDRRIALKVLRIEEGQGAVYRRAERRLLREAQSLARLSHPHVVSVHDVQSLHGSLVVAMDFIEGQTLRRWIEQPRPWSEIVAVMRQAGEGLAAAHRVGLVHRDFKPDNVMVDAGGRAHVVDFGLARAFDTRTLTEDTGVEEPGEDQADARAEFAGQTLLTRSGGRAGTPAYMAPEQHLGQGVGPSADQFAFCVVLYEALWGRRPFAGDTLVALTTAVFDGRIIPPPRDGDVPSRIREAIVRGLHVDPARRHDGMEALLAALHHDPAARRRRWLTVLGAAGLVVVASAGYLRDPDPSGPPPCTGGQDELRGIWDEPARQEAQDAVLATGRPYAEHGWTQAAPLIDDWAAEWAAMRDEACAATWVRGEQSERLLDRRMACLDGHRQELVAVGALLARADDEVVERLVRLASGLPRLSACADAEALMAAVPPPQEPAVREQVERIRGELARARALGLAGKYERARQEASDAVDEAARLGYAPVHAEALLRRGYLEDKVGDSAAAEVTLSSSAWLARRAGHDVVAARATTELTFVVGVQLERIEDGLQWSRHADAAVGRVGEPLARARLLNHRAMVLTTAARYHEAEIDIRRALTLRERWLPAGHPDISTTRTNLGVVLDDLGRRAEALAVYDEATAERERALGPEHPRVAGALTNSAHLLASMGRTDEALARARRALAIYDVALGPEHPDLAAAHNNLATVYFARDDYESAIESMERAVAIWERTRSPDHPDLADAHFNLGSVLFKLDRPEPAREHLATAHRIYLAAYGPEHPDVADVLLNLGIIDREQGDAERARERHTQMIEILRAIVPPDHPRLADGLTSLARDELAIDRFTEAEAAARQAVQIFERRRDVEPWRLAQARYLLAWARWSQGHDRAGAVAQVAGALAEVDDDELREEMSQWLAQAGHPVPPR